MDVLIIFKFWLWNYVSIAYWGAIVVLAVLVVMIITAKIINSQVVHCRDYTRLDGQTVVMTGGDAGVGMEAGRQLLARGCRLILACEDLDLGRHAAGKLMHHNDGSGTVLALPLTLSSPSSVRAFASLLLSTETRLDVLILNHSQTATRTREVTPEGIEKTMAATYFGHFLLANLLFSLLKMTPDSRVIVATSQIFSFLGTMNPKDLVFESERYTPLRANSLAKLCLVLFTRHFALLASRYDVLVNCFCPGFVASDGRDKNVDFLTGRLRRWAGYLVGRTPEQGSQTLVYLALSGKAVVGSGNFFVDCKGRHVSDLAANDGLARKIFEQSEDIVQLTDEERRYL